MGSEGVLKVIFERISTCFTLYISYMYYLYIYMKYAFLNIYHVNIDDIDTTMFRRVKF